MAWLIIQNTNQGSSGGNNTTSYTVTFGANNTPGSTLIASVGIQIGTNTAPNVSDPTNGNWTLLNSSLRSTTTGVFLYAVDNTASTALVVTTDAGGTTSFRRTNIYEATGGAAVASIIDVKGSTNGASAASTNLSQPTLTTTNAGDLIFTNLITGGIVTASSVNPGSGDIDTYTLQQQNQTGTIRLVDGTGMTSGSIADVANPYFSWTTSQAWAQATTALLPASGGVTPDAQDIGQQLMNIF